MATKKKSNSGIVYREPDDYFPKEALDILNGKKKAKKSTGKKPTSKKKK